MSERSAELLVEDMLEAVDRIQTYTRSIDLAAFMDDDMKVDAVLRNLQVLGEAAGRVPAEVRGLFPEIEWSRIVRSRHIVVHHYFGVDHEIIWRIIEVHLPPLREQLFRMREALG
jgi:uncharacterized protein with HEPN domain